MITRCRVMAFALFAAVSFLGLASASLAQGATRSGAPIATPVAAVDHIPIAVKDLPAAGEQYRKLGFSLKPARLHENSLDNLHAKNPNGTELELITASEPRDDLARKYLAYIAAGDGPAFIALRADFEDLTRALDAAKIPHERRGGWLMKATDPALHYVFFGQDNRSPTDRPAHLAHANGSTNLVAVWIADLENDRLIELLTALGATITDEPRLLPDGTGGKIAKLLDSEIRLVPASKRLIADRPIIGATLAARDSLAYAKTLPPTWWVRSQRFGYDGIVLKPEHTHGIWLEFQSSLR